MNHDDMIFDLWQAALSFRHLAQCARESGQDNGPVPTETAEYHASQIERIIKNLTSQKH